MPRKSTIAALTAATVNHDGWLNTGDMAQRAPDGDLFIVGRTKELIIHSGFNVHPAEVEGVLNAHPAVSQSAVIGRAVSGNEEVVAGLCMVQTTLAQAPRRRHRPSGVAIAS